VIDMHFHVLPGIDDGPDTMAGSVALARAAAAAGVSTLVATPHVSWRYRNDAQTIRGLVDELGERLTAEGVAIELRAGAEVAMTYLTELERAELTELRLGQGEWLLVEPPFAAVAPALGDIVREVQRRGHRVLLAHPERCPAFHRDPDLLAELVRGGALASITAGSLAGRFGGPPRRFALKLLQEGLVHNVASDAHDLDGRAPGIAAELEQAGAASLTDWLTCAVPEAILGGDEIPARPQLLRSSRGRRWRVRR
jgi:protein-tyrosine phosphatase